jgi:hypothetical protein
MHTVVATVKENYHSRINCIGDGVKLLLLTCINGFYATSFRTSCLISSHVQA